MLGILRYGVLQGRRETGCRVHAGTGAESRQGATCSLTLRARWRNDYRRIRRDYVEDRAKHYHDGKTHQACVPWLKTLERVLHKERMKWRQMWLREYGYL